MTDEIFRRDAYAKTCEAVITGCDARGLRLDRTVFYPMGGGQPGDSGGPWYDDRTAWGTHTGVSGTMEVASYADLAWEALGVTVLK